MLMGQAPVYPTPESSTDRLRDFVVEVVLRPPADAVTALDVVANVIYRGNSRKILAVRDVRRADG